MLVSLTVPLVRVVGCFANSDCNRRGNKKNNNLMNCINIFLMGSKTHNKFRILYCYHGSVGQSMCQCLQGRGFKAYVRKHNHITAGHQKLFQGQWKNGWPYIVSPRLTFSPMLVSLLGEQEGTCENEGIFKYVYMYNGEWDVVIIISDIPWPLLTCCFMRNTWSSSAFTSLSWTNWIDTGWKEGDGWRQLTQ